ncbi:uncharacterized protein LOC120106086 [Phoenix dactylifera]|uniref:Uncharacterized protein LOC120106086 n=1 Tax=Phoenix dactylifera TaxID=42345 RepID=A0A8B8ZL17_PHODC|nr:uncharacterized protein LOC120106086 [Phoenix dactylifera]
MYSNSDLVRKILRSLPRTWEAKVTAIQEAKDLSILPLEELLGSLMTHELTMNQHLEDESQKRKGIAFKASTQKECNESSDEGEDESENDDIALFAKKFSKFMRRRKMNFKRNPITRSEAEKDKEKGKDSLVCYECKRPGHFRLDCPLLKKSQKKTKKAFVAMWGDSDESSSEEEPQEVANICLVPQDNEISPNASPSFTFDELYEAFNELVRDYKKLGMKNKDLRTENKILNELSEKYNEEKQSLTNEMQMLNSENQKKVKQNEELLNENQNLKKEVDKYKLIVNKFTGSSERLDMILNSQRAVFNKAGLGFRPKKEQKLLKNFFVKATKTEAIQSTYFCCGKPRHKSYMCNYRQTLKKGNLKKIWIPKETAHTNYEGPKKTWVPKAL